MSHAHEALARAVEAADGQVALATKLGLKQSTVWTWLNKSKRGTPGEFVIPIERITGVSRHDLRPDLYPPEPGASPTDPQPSPPSLTGGAAERRIEQREVA